MVRVGFFKPGEVPQRKLTLDVLREPGCNACGLYKGCLSPKMPPRGQGRKGILIVGEAPGRTEDEQGRPFVGKTGLELQKALRRAGVETFTDCTIVNAVSCRPKGNKLPDNARRTIELCRPLVLKAIKEHQPSLIILLGGAAVASVIGWLWRDDVGGITAWAGRQIPSRRLNAWVCPTWHPSFILRGSGGRGPDVAAALWQSHLDAACALIGRRPYDPQPPEAERCVRKEHDPTKAADLIHRYIDLGRPVAFDYETDRLKADAEDARVVCAAVSDGVTSAAFPWHGRAVHAMEELLRGDVPKLGWNAKFEERWTRRVLGFSVNNWALDGMLAAHVLDGRKGTKSLKFQAFVRLGADSYDDAVKPYLKAEGGNARNRVGEISLDKLLLYCGTDALYEAQLGKILGPQVGVDLWR